MIERHNKINITSLNINKGTQPKQRKGGKVENIERKWKKKQMALNEGNITHLKSLVSQMLKTLKNIKIWAIQYISRDLNK